MHVWMCLLKNNFSLLEKLHAFLVFSIIIMLDIFKYEIIIKELMLLMLRLKNIVAIKTIVRNVKSNETKLAIFHRELHRMMESYFVSCSSWYKNIRFVFDSRKVPLNVLKAGVVFILIFFEFHWDSWICFFHQCRLYVESNE